MKTLKFKDFKAKWILEGIKTSKKYYDDKVNLDTMVKVVKFELVNLNLTPTN